MEKYELPCGIVEDLLPSYVDGLTGQESSAAVRRHLEGCPACREKYETMGAAEREVAQKDAPVIDAFAAWNRKAVRRVVLAVAGTVVLIVLALVLRTYVFGTPFRDYELEWTVQDYGSYVDIRVAPLDPNLRILGGTWEETVEDGQSTYRFTGKKVRASFLNFSSDSYGYGAPSELLHEIYVGDTLIWADGLEISEESRALYHACTPYVGNPSALMIVAAAVGINDEVGVFDNELQTAEEPYGWTLRFENNTPGGAHLDEQGIAWINWNMRRKAAQILAVVENLGYVPWSYTDENDTLHTETVTLEAVNALLPELVVRYNARFHTGWTAKDSVKDYAVSPAALEQLRRLLDLAE